MLLTNRIELLKDVRLQHRNASPHNFSLEISTAQSHVPLLSSAPLLGPGRSPVTSGPEQWACSTAQLPGIRSQWASLSFLSATPGLHVLQRTHAKISWFQRAITA